MRKCFSIIISFLLMISCILPIKQEKVHANINNEYVVDDLDWSKIGARNVKITYKENQSILSRAILNEPSVEIEYDLDGYGKVYFERIDNVGYFYINNEFITNVTYNSDIRTNTVSLNELIADYYSAPASGFSTFNYWAKEGWIIREVKELTENVTVALISTAITGSLSNFPILAGIYNTVEEAEEIYEYWEVTLGRNKLNIYGYTLFYNSQYFECNILHWYGVVLAQFDDSTYNKGTVVEPFEKATKHYWYANPNDYTQPTACRLITSTYPY